MTKTPSHPRNASLSMPMSSRSPGTTSTPRLAQSAAFPLSRTTPRTFFPALSKALAVVPPTFPVIPITVNIVVPFDDVDVFLKESVRFLLVYGSMHPQRPTSLTSPSCEENPDASRLFARSYKPAANRPPPHCPSQRTRRNIESPPPPH